MTTKMATINGEEFVLHPSGAMFWTDRHLLLVSDVHLGKVSHFRKHGVAIPPESIGWNFGELNKVLDHFNPEALIFLGDLFHSKKNREWDLFEEWLLTVKSEIVLVAGNHDIIAREHYDKLEIKVCSELAVGNFILTHHPDVREGFFNFCGHIHPAVRLVGVGRQSIKLPCFFQSQNQMILPAFGEFTGTYDLLPSEHDCVYAIAGDEVILIC